MLTRTSYFGFLLVTLTITSALFIGPSKIRLIKKILLEINNSENKSLCKITCIL